MRKFSRISRAPTLNVKIQMKFCINLMELLLLIMCLFP